MMKKKGYFLILFYFLFYKTSIANVYTCTGAGSWTTISNWFPSYPGLTIALGDEVIISPTSNIFTPMSTTLTINGTLTLNNSSLSISGDLVLNGTISSNNGVFGVNGSPSGGLFENYGVFSNAGTINISPGGAHWINAFGSTFANAGGTINNDGTFTNYGTITNSGTFRNNFAQLNSGEGVLINEGTITNSGTIQTYPNGAIINNETLNNTGILTNSGAYSGTGIYSGTVFNNSGSISPGNSPGCITLDSDFQNSGLMNIEIAGLSSCSQFDKIIVSQTATLSGELSVSQINGFIGQSGDQIEFLTASSIVGSFSSITLPSNWFLNYTNTGLVLSFGMALPISLSELTGSQVEQSIELTWKTTNEISNKGFEVQRSSDGELWDILEFISSKGSIGAKDKYYNFTDNHPYNRINYYRLKQQDFDGSENFSPIVSVPYHVKNKTPLNIFPNPCGDNLNIEIGNNINDTFIINIFDAYGKHLRYYLLDENIKMLNVEGLPKGVYQLEVWGEDTRKIFVKQ